MRNPTILAAILISSAAHDASATRPDNNNTASLLNCEQVFSSHTPFALQHASGQPLSLVPTASKVDDQAGTRVVRGVVASGGWFVLAQGTAGLEGAVWTSDGSFSIRGSSLDPNRQLATVELIPATHTSDHAVEHTCAGGLLPEGIDHAITSRPIDPMPIDPNEITRGSVEPTRVLVIYDQNALDGVGDINAYIAAMIESANVCYDNSGTTGVQIELAGSSFVSDQLSNDFGTVLRQATNRYDGVGDQMHALRDATDADVIATLVDQPGYCGLAWLAPEFPDYAVSTSHINCALTGLTFAHELGHNQGCNHDPDNAGSSYQPYGFGHRWDNNGRRSVMAYAPGSRVLHFSNPDVLYDNIPTGIANQRDNARLLDLTHPLMSTMRIGDGSGEDCDGEGTPDRLQIVTNPQLDLDQDGRIDACQIQDDPTLDCNNDGLIDTEQTRPRIRRLLGTTMLFGAGIEPNFTTEPLPAPVGDITIEVGVVGNVASADESLELEFNNGLFSIDAFASNWSNCYAPGHLQTLTVDGGDLAQVLSEGIDLRIIPSASVDPDECSHPALAVWIEYRTADQSIDANGDGLIDSCACPADVDGDGNLSFFDVSEFITGFLSMDPASDWNNDSVFDFFDVSAFLLAFNAGCP